MSRPQLLPTRFFHLAIFAAGLAGLVLQFHVSHGIMLSRGLGIGTTLFKLAGYFTILTNFLLTAAHALCLFAARSSLGRWLGRPSLQSGLLLYILIVGLVYVVLLSGLWKPEGVQWWADHLLHHLTPLLQLAFWIFAVPKEQLPWKLAVSWLGYPALYLAWVFVRGSRVSDYPYPFVDLEKLGLVRTLLNSAGMGMAFLVAGLAIIASSRALARDHSTSSR
jgi:hypothetical protein